MVMWDSLSAPSPSERWKAYPLKAPRRCPPAYLGGATGLRRFYREAFRTLGQLKLKTNNFVLEAGAALTHGKKYAKQAETATGCRLTWEPYANRGVSGLVSRECCRAYVRQISKFGGGIP